MSIIPVENNPLIELSKKEACNRVMLIEPPFNRLFHDNFSLVKYPLALGYLSEAVLKWTDWDVQTYNADFNPNQAITVSNSYLMKEGFKRYLRTLFDHQASIWQEVNNAISEYSPDVLGITAKTQNFKSATIVASLAKKLNPDIKVVLGGPHATLSSADALECTDIDVAVMGEGEMTLVELLSAFEKGTPLTEVNGIALRTQTGSVNTVTKTASRAYIPDLDALPFPSQSAPQVLRNYSDYPLEAFKYIFSARGCPYACTFCESKAIWTQKTRWRSPENVLGEIKMLMERGLDVIYFDDDTFGINPRYIQKLCNLIETECPGLRWGCEMTVSISKEASVEYMRRAGCNLVFMGVESGNNAMLRKIKKSQTIESAYKAVDLYRAKDIEINTFFMIGFPEETEETLADTLTAIKKINADIIIWNVFTPYPGSQLFDVCKKLGLVDDDFDVTLYNHQSPENCFTAYITRDRFKILSKEIAAIVDRKNNLNRVHKALRMLRQHGVIYTFRKTVRFALGRMVTRIESLQATTGQV